eukprot:Phypoly_transcript_08648.p1 GENE.Phypoly_transcript_08648~~Phypoly_transcript_08648.p1  ORF type:complete len:467 (+),score=77.63 Phypoly_transcript_08648:80-1480(+)
MFDPVELSDETLNCLQEQAHDYAVGHGIMIYKKGDPGVTHAPFTLLPSPFPAELFRQATKLAPDYNLLVHEISKKKDFILSTLENVPDEFTQRLIKIFKTVHEEGITQPISLAIHRSDYMIHNPSPDKYVLQQVELNTISAAFPSLSTQTSLMHKYMVERYNLTSLFPPFALPENTALYSIARFLTMAHNNYGDLANTSIIMVVQKGERNKWDQRHLEYRLFQWHGVKVMRATLTDIHEKGSLNEAKELVYNGKKISVVYFRAGYTPNDYPTENEWDARLLVERSKAVKCPNISYHLAGTKKMQQVISAPGVLESIISDKESVSRMRASFTGLYSLSGPEAKDIIEKAKQNYKDYVMKPQREGGGNNIYNEDMKKALETMTPEELSAYILMDRIRPPAISTHVMREGKLGTMQAVYELGIYGGFLADNDKIYENASAGLLLRTKGAMVEDGGVAAGVAVLDSPLLV